MSLVSRVAHAPQRLPDWTQIEIQSGQNLVHKMLLASQTLRYAALRMDTLILFLTLQGSYSADTQAYNERCLLYTGLGRDETKTSGACPSPRRPRS